MARPHALGVIQDEHGALPPQHNIQVLHQPLRGVALRGSRGAAQGVQARHAVASAWREARPALANSVGADELPRRHPLAVGNAAQEAAPHRTALRSPAQPSMQRSRHTAEMTRPWKRWPRGSSSLAISPA